MSKKEKHEFAFYVTGLSRALQGDTFVITDEKLVHRLQAIVRISLGQECIFFDRDSNVRCIVQEYIGKNRIQCIIKEHRVNNLLLPKIIFLLPVLKKDDLESAIYSLTEIGVTTIQLVVTQKTHSFSFNQKEKERLQRIIIAAAEQSKNFSYPELKDPIHMAEALDLYDTIKEKIFFDAHARSCVSVMQRLSSIPLLDILLFVGPEGDLINEEKELIVSKNFTICTLTPTILRSVQAVILSAGFIRSICTSILLFVFK